MAYRRELHRVGTSECKPQQKSSSDKSEELFDIFESIFLSYNLTYLPLAPITGGLELAPYL